MAPREGTSLVEMAFAPDGLGGRGPSVADSVEHGPHLVLGPQQGQCTFDTIPDFVLLQKRQQGGQELGACAAEL